MVSFGRFLGSFVRETPRNNMSFVQVGKKREIEHLSTTKLLVWWTLVWPFGTIRMRNLAQVFINIVLEPTLHTTDCSLSQQYEKTNSSCWWRLRGIFSKHSSKLTFSHWTSTCNYQPYNPTTWLSAFPILVYPRCVGLNSIDIFFSPNNAGQWKDVCPSFSFPPRALVWFFRFFWVPRVFSPKNIPKHFQEKHPVETVRCWILNCFVTWVDWWLRLERFVGDWCF